MGSGMISTGSCIFRTNRSVRSLSMPRSCVMRLAQKKVKVVLDGQGADELLARLSCLPGELYRGACPGVPLGDRPFRSDRQHPSSSWVFRKRDTADFSQGKNGGPCCDALLRQLTDTRGSLDEVLYRELTSTNLPALLHYEGPERNGILHRVPRAVPGYPGRGIYRCTPALQKIRNGVTKIALRNAT